MGDKTTTPAPFWPFWNPGVVLFHLGVFFWGGVSPWGGFITLLRGGGGGGGGGCHPFQAGGGGGMAPCEPGTRVVEDRLSSVYLFAFVLRSNMGKRRLVQGMIFLLFGYRMSDQARHKFTDAVGAWCLGLGFATCVANQADTGLGIEIVHNFGDPHDMTLREPFWVFAQFSWTLKFRQT